MYSKKKQPKVMVNGWRSAHAGELKMLELSEKEKYGEDFVKAELMDEIVRLGMNSFKSGWISSAEPACQAQAKMPEQKPVKQVAIDTAADDFEIFWTAGMAKNNKKKAFSLFKSLASKNDGTLEFARLLASDVRVRLKGGQMGFDSMHPTTYLNGERWKDAIPSPVNHPQVDRLATPDRTELFNEMGVGQEAPFYNPLSIEGD